MFEFQDGIVVHQREGQVTHELRHKVLSVTCDVDELDQKQIVSFYNIGRWPLLTFRRQDFGPRNGTELRPYIEKILQHGNISWTPEFIELQAFPRFIGYGFNPMATFRCWYKDEIAAIIYEVSNTFGEHTHYVFPHPPNMRHSGVKSFHVSPFFSTKGVYVFSSRQSNMGGSMVIRYTHDGPFGLLATHRWKNIGHKISFKLIIQRFPHSLGVIMAIHWHALRTFLKGAKYHKRPERRGIPIHILSKDMSSH